MAGFIRRFTQFPPLSVITEIEGIDIIDLLPTGIFVGVGTGTLCLVGEWPRGAYDRPVEVTGDADIRGAMGGFSPSITNPLAFSTNPWSNGNAFVWLKNKTFTRLVLVRAKMEIPEVLTVVVTGTFPIDFAGTVNGPLVPAGGLKLPGGTRVFNPAATTEEFALAQDVIIAEGTDLTVVATTVFAFNPNTNATTPSTARGVTGVPVYSTRGNAAAVAGTVTSANTSDLFRAGIGAGTALPAIVVSVNNLTPLTVLVLATVETNYGAAITSTLAGSIEPAASINLIAAARESDVIRTALQNNAVASSQIGMGRVALLRPRVGTLPTTAAGELFDPAAAGNAVTAHRYDRVIYCYPHFEQTIDEIVQLNPNNPTLGNVLVGADAAMGTICSMLAPEANPGESTDLIEFIRRLEDGLSGGGAGTPTNFNINHYKAFKRNGVAALRRDTRIQRWEFQSGVTAVDPQLYPTAAPISRRRFADFVQDSLAAISLVYNKKPATEDRKDALVGGLFDFLDTLRAENNPAQRRIESFSLDSKSGNTAQQEGLGIYVVIVKVRQVATLDEIVLQTTIGPTVEVAA